MVEPARTIMQLVIMIIYVLCSVSGLVLFKLGSTEALTLEATQSFFSLKISWLSILGLILYIISFLIYMGLVSKNNLSYLLPVVTGAVYLLTMLSSVLIFKESIHYVQLIGSALILLGLVLMNVKLK